MKLIPFTSLKPHDVVVWEGTRQRVMSRTPAAGQFGRDRVTVLGVTPEDRARTWAAPWDLSSSYADRALVPVEEIVLPGIAVLVSPRSGLMGTTDSADRR